MKIVKEQFEAYTDIQESGITNMYSINDVMELTGLTKEEIRYIMNHYEELQKEYKK